MYPKFYEIQIWIRPFSKYRSGSDLFRNTDLNPTFFEIQIWIRPFSKYRSGFELFIHTDLDETKAPGSGPCATRDTRGGEQ